MEARFRTLVHAGLQLSLVLLFAFPIFHLRFSVFIVILFLLFSGITLFLSKETLRDKERLLLLAAFFLLPIIYLNELTYTENLTYVWFIVQRKMGLILIPVGFFMLYRSGFVLNGRRHVNVFVASNIGLVLYASTMILLNGLNPEHVDTGGVAFAFRTAVSSYVHLHPTYLGMMVSFSALVLINGMLDTRLISKPFVLRTVFTLVLVLFSIDSGGTDGICSILGCSFCFKLYQVE